VPAPVAVEQAAPGGDSAQEDESLHAGVPDREHLVAALDQSGWVQAKAARLLNLTPRQIGYAIRKHGITVKRF
jgi:Nif-specific regulatory protein